MTQIIRHWAAVDVDKSGHNQSHQRTYRHVRLRYDRQVLMYKTNKSGDWTRSLGGAAGRLKDMDKTLFNLLGSIGTPVNVLNPVASQSAEMWCWKTLKSWKRSDKKQPSKIRSTIQMVPGPRRGQCSPWSRSRPWRVSSWSGEEPETRNPVRLKSLWRWLVHRQVIIIIKGTLEDVHQEAQSPTHQTRTSWQHLSEKPDVGHCGHKIVLVFAK